MVEYKQLLLSVALTNPLALVLAYIFLKTALFLKGDNMGLIAQHGRPALEEGLLADVLLALFFLVTVSVIHWWKYREKYKGLTKVKALMEILPNGVINLLLLEASVSSLIFFGLPFVDANHNKVFKGISVRSRILLVLCMIAVPLSGVISELLWHPE
jgi:hypothetical protein